MSSPVESDIEWLVMGEIPKYDSLPLIEINKGRVSTINTDPNTPLLHTLQTGNGWTLNYFGTKGTTGDVTGMTCFHAQYHTGEELIITINNKYQPFEISRGDGKVFRVDWQNHTISVEDKELFCPAPMNGKSFPTGLLSSTMKPSFPEIRVKNKCGEPINTIDSLRMNVTVIDYAHTLSFKNWDRMGDGIYTVDLSSLPEEWVPIDPDDNTFRTILTNLCKYESDFKASLCGGVASAVGIFGGSTLATYCKLASDAEKAECEKYIGSDHLFPEDLVELTPIAKVDGKSYIGKSKRTNVGDINQPFEIFVEHGECNAIYVNNVSGRDESRCGIAGPPCKTINWAIQEAENVDMERVIVQYTGIPYMPDKTVSIGGFHPLILEAESGVFVNVIDDGEFYVHARKADVTIQGFTMNSGEAIGKHDENITVYGEGSGTVKLVGNKIDHAIVAILSGATVIMRDNTLTEKAGHATVQIAYGNAKANLINNNIQGSFYVEGAAAYLAGNIIMGSIYCFVGGELLSAGGNVINREPYGCSAGCDPDPGKTCSF